MRILVIDNYDSFTYNLVQMFERFEGATVVVKRNDQVSLQEVNEASRLVLSPGPGIPSEAGRMPEIVKEFAPSKKILGVCLGHQCIGEIFGGTLRNIDTPVHGKATPITVTVEDESLFSGLPKELSVGRYHSWVVDREGFPADLEITAVDASGQVMALRHKRYDVRGVQFHPESILTDYGYEMLKNWMAS
jgi:anthranilate synthase component 2